LTYNIEFYFFLTLTYIEMFLPRCSLRLLQSNHLNIICLIKRAPATVHDQYESPTVGDQKILICFFFLKKTKHNVFNKYYLGIVKKKLILFRLNWTIGPLTYLFVSY
jgi:hypothetical protein